MKLIINFKEEEYEKEPLTVSEMLELKKVKFPHLMRVQLNGKLIKKNEYDRVTLKENDKINLMFPIGGG